jgi:hypothetical protein
MEIKEQINITDLTEKKEKTFWTLSVTVADPFQLFIAVAYPFALSVSISYPYPFVLSNTATMQFTFLITIAGKILLPIAALFNQIAALSVTATGRITI